MNDVQDTCDMSLDLTGISMEIVGIGCLESYLCAQVYLQNVFARMELLVVEECSVTQTIDETRIERTERLRLSLDGSDCFDVGGS